MCLCFLCKIKKWKIIFLTYLNGNSAVNLPCLRWCGIFNSTSCRLLFFFFWNCHSEVVVAAPPLVHDGKNDSVTMHIYTFFSLPLWQNKMRALLLFVWAAMPHLRVFPKHQFQVDMKMKKCCCTSWILYEYAVRECFFLSQRSYEAANSTTGVAILKSLVLFT